MLSPDRSEPRAGGSRRPRRRGRSRHLGESAATPDGLPWEPVQSFGPSEPWDVRSAEALTRLYESEEGDLSRPARCRPARQARAQSASPDSTAEKEPIDKTWLEAHIARLVKRLQDTLAKSNPSQSLAALNERLDTFEQRFSAALGRVAHRSDLDGLKSIEANVMELAAQLDRARDRLELIGDVDEEVRGLARKLDETGEQRADALEKLLRDCMAEWRESEQRTASALQNLEEAVNRLGDTVDAMEASKPAPELSVPPLAPELERTAVAADSLSRLHTVNGRPHTHFYHSMLDAADYAPRAADRSPAAEPASNARLSALPATAVEWSAPPPGSHLDRSVASPSTAAGWSVAAMRDKPRQAPFGFEAASPDLPLPNAAAPDTFKRASLNVLLMAGAAVLAGTTYILSRTVAAPFAPIGPSTREPAGEEELADPAGQRFRGEGAG